MIDPTDMISAVLAQIDAVAAAKYPDANKYAIRAGMLQALLWSTLGHLNQNQRGFWMEHQEAVFTRQLNEEVK